MTVLSTTKTWRRPLAASPETSPDLTPDEVAAVKRALVFLRVRLWSVPKLAAELKVRPSMVAMAVAIE